jgi:hypothetical protein
MVGALLLFVVVGSLFRPAGDVVRGQSKADKKPQPREHLDLPVSIEAPVEPIPVKGDDGKWYFIYHLFITNWSFSDLTLKRVEIRSERGGQVLAEYGVKELEQWHRFRAVLPTPAPLRLRNRAELRTVNSGWTGVLFAGFTLDKREAIPTVLRHQFAFEANPPITLLRDRPRDQEGELLLEDYPVKVSGNKPLTIGPPLRGGPWKCSGATDPFSLHQHQTSLVVQEGRARIPERFAIDFQKIDERGDILPSPFPEKISNKLFYSYGEEVLAVADGVVAAVKDGVRENSPQADGRIKLAAPVSRDTNAGNQVSLDLGNGRYAFYAHLQPGSIRIRAGDKVRRGQLLALVGNSGNAVGPHLHFHVGDRNSLNGCEGVPFVFDSFDVVGRWPKDYKPATTKSPVRHHQLEMPLKDTVVSFPDSKKR